MRGESQLHLIPPLSIRLLIWPSPPLRRDALESDTEVPLNGTGGLIAAEATAKVLTAAAESNGHALCNGLNGRVEGEFRTTAVEHRQALIRYWGRGVCLHLEVERLPKVSKPDIR